MKSSIKKGDKYNRLTAIKFSHKNKKYNQYWLFECDCGNKRIIRVGSVKNEDTKSCGCLMKKGNNLKHGMFGTKIYGIWTQMKKRCFNKNCKVYKNYGGRGITVCKEWMKFENFYRDMGDRPEGKTLDRIKNNLGYCKKNCQWATWEEQENNRRNNRFLTYNDKTQTVSQWAKELNINCSTLFGRVRNGWNTERALTYKRN